jgi:hypothetical protein
LDGKKQERVAFLCPNDASYIIAQWACWMSGQIGKFVLQTWVLKFTPLIHVQFMYSQLQCDLCSCNTNAKVCQFYVVYTVCCITTNTLIHLKPTKCTLV